jgi:predicted DNA-binding WGR domain protein
MSDSPRRFTFIAASSRKFWEIKEPEQVENNRWAVTVTFGRIGTWGQDHTNVFSSKYAAREHYMRKIAEKEKKGYKETGKAQVKNNVVNYTPDYVQPAPKTKQCLHNGLVRAGTKWKCSECGKVVEFEKTASVQELEVVATVRRYFNLSGRS